MQDPAFLHIKPIHKHLLMKQRKPSTVVLNRKVEGFLTCITSNACLQKSRAKAHSFRGWMKA